VKEVKLNDVRAHFSLAGNRRMSEAEDRQDVRGAQDNTLFLPCNITFLLTRISYRTADSYYFLPPFLFFRGLPIEQQQIPINRTASIDVCMLCTTECVVRFSLLIFQCTFGFIDYFLPLFHLRVAHEVSRAGACVLCV